MGRDVSSLSGETLMKFDIGYKTADLLTYLLTYLSRYLVFDVHQIVPEKAIKNDDE